MTSPEPSADPTAPTEVAAYLVGLLIFLVLTGISVGAAFEDTETPAARAGTGHAEAAPVSVFDDLTCFTCHSLETYRNGGDGAFPHDFHYEMLGMEADCHRCHVFNNHMPEAVPLPDCADCH